MWKFILSKMNVKIQIIIIFVVLSVISQEVNSEKQTKSNSKRLKKIAGIKNIQSQQPIVDYDDYYEEANIVTDSNEEVDVKTLITFFTVFCTTNHA
uniref:CSON013111 protein n=1 Tax=Culicoides sonorensis TaxID=179676 RepID=A0A336KN00_CULSO